MDLRLRPTAARGLKGDERLSEAAEAWDRAPQEGRVKQRTARWGKRAHRNRQSEVQCGPSVSYGPEQTLFSEQCSAVLEASWVMVVIISSPHPSGSRRTDREGLRHTLDEVGELQPVRPEHGEHVLDIAFGAVDFLSREVAMESGASTAQHAHSRSYTYAHAHTQR